MFSVEDYNKDKIIQYISSGEDSNRDNIIKNSKSS